MTKGRVLLIVGLLLCAKPGFAGPLSFEGNDFTADGWVFEGLAEVVTDASLPQDFFPGFFNFGPSNGNYFALLESGPDANTGATGVDALTLDRFFGFDDGYLAGQGYTGGSAVGRSVNMLANEIGSFDFIFVSDDFARNDAALFVMDGQGNLVHDAFIISADVPGGTSEPWQTYNNAFMATTAGTYFIGVGVLNRTDSTQTSYLAVDNFKVVDTGEAQPVPEPATLLLLTAGGGTAFVARRLRRRLPRV